MVLLPWEIRCGPDGEPLTAAIWRSGTYLRNGENRQNHRKYRCEKDQ